LRGSSLIIILAALHNKSFYGKFGGRISMCEAHFNCIMQSIETRSSQGWIIINAEYEVVYVNESFCRMWQCTRENLLGKSLLQWYDGEKQNSQGRYFGPLIETMATGIEMQNVEARLPKYLSDECIWQLVDTFLIRDNKEKVEFGVASYSVIERFKAIEQQLNSINLKVIKAFSKAIGARDVYTMQHSEKVAALMFGLAEAMLLSKHEVTLAYLAGIVHDVGKIGVPENVLNKPGRLTEEEFILMKQHPTIGSDILRQIDGFADIASIVLHHHERYDGKGYPQQIAGESIPLLSRMLAVCDSYDAMVSARCYRQPVTKAQAMAEIEKCSSSQFDPVIAACFLRFLNSDLSLAAVD